MSDTPSAANDELDKLIERNILVDLRSMNTDPEYNEATMELTHLKKDIAAYVAQAERKARIDELKKVAAERYNEPTVLPSVIRYTFVADRIAELERESDGS